MTITQSLAKDFLAVLRRLLPRRLHSQLIVEVLQSDDRVGLRIASQGYALAWGSFEAATTSRIGVPVQLLRESAGSRPNPVNVSVPDDTSVQSQWTDHGIPQLRRYDRIETAEVAAFPSPPKAFHVQSSELLEALAQASVTCDPESSRYALGCIQMRGRRGDVVATDGRQVLVQGGFHLGFDDDILVPGSNVFACPVWKDQPVASGITDEHYVLRIGEWSLWLPLQNDRRFPQVDDIIPDRSYALSDMELSAGDQAFLADSLDRLPGKDDPHSPVTIELNGIFVSNRVTKWLRRPTGQADLKSLIRLLRAGIRPLRLLRDLAIILALSAHYGLVTAMTTFEVGGIGAAVVTLTLTGLFSMLVGFSIAGYLTAERRWTHMCALALATWLTNLANVVFFGVTVTEWMGSLPFILIAMVLGGSITTLLARRSPQAPPLPVMSHEIEFDCEHCGERLAIAADLIGRQVACGSCGMASQAPATSRGAVRERTKA